MGERTDELTRDDEVSVDDAGAVGGDAATGDVDFETEFDVGGTTGPDRTAHETDAAETTARTGSSRVGRVRERAGTVFSPAAFVVHLVGALVGVFVVGGFVPLVPFAGFVGLLLTAGLLGTLSSTPRYVESAVAGGASGALALFLGSMTLSVVTGGLLPAAGALAGALAAVVGFYAGRDLRDGLTKDL